MERPGSSTNIGLGNRPGRTIDQVGNLRNQESRTTEKIKISDVGTKTNQSDSGNFGNQKPTLTIGEGKTKVSRLAARVEGIIGLVNVIIDYSKKRGNNKSRSIDLVLLIVWIIIHMLIGRFIF